MTGSSRIDWAQAHERLERARSALARGAELTPEQAASLLEQRARALALPPQEAPASQAHDVVLLSLAGEWHAVDVSCVLEVLPAQSPTPLPRMPAFVLGVVGHRGRILPVLDLARPLGLADGCAEAPHVVAVAVQDMVFGIVAEAVEGPVGHDAGDRLVSPLDLSELVARGVLEIEEDR